MTDAPVASPLRNGYLVRNRTLNGVLRVIDRLLSSCNAKVRAVSPPRRILVANIAHLGDVLLSTGVLAALRDSFPGLFIGFLAGSWSRMVLEGHPLVDALHHFDHARLNRSAGLRWQKVCRHLVTRRRAIATIRAARYDVAIDLYPYFPNAIPLLWAAGVPVRIGYTSGGFGPLLTHPTSWPMRDWHVTRYHAHLLEQLPLPRALPLSLAPVLPKDGTTLPDGLPFNYVVIHPGAGAGFKSWPIERWRLLAQQVRALGHPLVLTGSGDNEKQTCAAVTMGQADCVDLCGRLSWRQFVAVVRQARLVVGLDSLAGHVAAAAGIPCVVIATGIPHPAHWTPSGPAVEVLRHPVSCSPCYRSRGCDSMECIREVRADDVLSAVRKLLESSRPAAYAA